MLEESTMWWFVALLFLLGFSTPDILVKVDRRFGNTASYTRTVIIEAVTFHAVDGAQRGSGWRLRPWAAIVSETTSRGF